MTVAMLTLMIIFGIAVIILVYMQSGYVKAAGSSITNAQDLELFENKKIRGAERWLNIGTWISVLLFISFAIVLFVTL